MRKKKERKMDITYSSFHLAMSKQMKKNKLLFYSNMLKKEDEMERTREILFGKRVHMLHVAFAYLIL